MFTSFSRKALASAFAPSGPILLCSRLTVVSVYDRKLKIGTRNTKEKKMFTSFSRKALASAFAPLFPMPFPPRLKVVSAYARKLKI
jgi:hypothetical protein